MFNNAQKSMLCVTCFQNAPNETRMHCVDIDTAYQQSSKKLDRAVGVSETNFCVGTIFFFTFNVMKKFF